MNFVLLCWAVSFCGRTGVLVRGLFGLATGETGQDFTKRGHTETKILYYKMSNYFSKNVLWYKDLMKQLDIEVSTPANDS